MRFMITPFAVIGSVSPENPSLTLPYGVQD